LLIVEIAQAQRDVRRTFIGGFAGQLVSSGVWFLSAASATWLSFRTGFLVLVIGGFFIFPLTQLVLRLMGRPASLPKRHPMNGLAIQVAFVLPFTLPLVFAATAYHHSWFYPALMIALGAHYLPFIFLYGMPEFGVLAGLLIASGFVIGLYLPVAPSFGGWLTAGVLFIFSFVGRRTALAEY
jgi:hypothetical protein